MNLSVMYFFFVVVVVVVVAFDWCAQLFAFIYCGRHCSRCCSGTIVFLHCHRHFHLFHFYLFSKVLFIPFIIPFNSTFRTKFDTTFVAVTIQLQTDTIHQQTAQYEKRGDYMKIHFFYLFFSLQITYPVHCKEEENCLSFIFHCFHLFMH